MKQNTAIHSHGRFQWVVEIFSEHSSQLQLPPLNTFTFLYVYAIVWKLNTPAANTLKMNYVHTL